MTAGRRAAILARNGRYGDPNPVPPAVAPGAARAEPVPGRGRAAPAAAARSMNGDHPAAETAPGWGPRVRRRAAQLGVGEGEAIELLQRLPAAAADGRRAAALGWGDQLSAVRRRTTARRVATRALDAYAARKRAVARLAQRGHL
jgi:hypothetical protein